MKRERAKRKKTSHVSAQAHTPFCIEYNENWKTKFENRAQVSVTHTKTRLTDTRKGHCSKSSGMSMERGTVEATYTIILPEEQGEPYAMHLRSR